MKIIIQKFGGTSVSTIQRREMVADKVLEALNSSLQPVVVVSAIGRKGDPYATDTLLSLINNDNKQVGKRETDLLLSCGEIISSVVLAETFGRKGIATIVLTGGQAGILTDSNFGNAHIKLVNTTRLISLLNKGIVPIVTGFQGINEDLDVTTLGRGASDVTAAILGEALKAEVIEIYTDVDGIMTADPRIVKDAHMIERISYSDVFHFADQGAKVIHPKAVEYAMRGNIPIIIRNASNSSKGTLITSAETSNRTIAGVAHQSNRTQIRLEFDNPDAVLANNEIFELIAAKGISMDLISLFPCFKTFTIDSSDSVQIKTLLTENNYKFTIVDNCCKITVISNKIKGIPGIIAQILRILENLKIPVLQTGDSHTSIWCLVRDEDSIEAINALHNVFAVEIASQ